jgi:hypothetical protein
MGFGKGKKAMGIGQVFVFIVAAVTFALIMIFGYSAITSFLESGEEVEFVQFKTDLENSIKKIYTEYSSVRVKDFSLPVKYEQICFINLEYPVDEITLEMEELCKLDAAACDVWADARSIQNSGKNGFENVDQNVFLKPPAMKIKTYHISISDPEGEEKLGFLCEKITNGRFSIVLEGKGDLTELSKAS